MTLLKILEFLKNYYNQSKFSLLALIVGIFEINLEGFKSINVIVMKNGTKKYNLNSKLLYKFDIKGSKLNRTSLPGKVKLRDLKSGIILKDLDLI